MPYTPTPNDGLLEVSIAADALTQLNASCIYPKTGVVDYEDGAFERGETVKIRRSKRRRAQDLDPRVAAATYAEAQFFKGQVALERLWTDGFPVYGHDSKQTIDKYITESATQMADAVSTPNEEYLYSVFRTWNLPSTGAVALGDHPPIAIVASVDASGNFGLMDNAVARNSQLVMDRGNVPNSGKLSTVLSSQAKSDFLGDTTILGFAGMTAQAGNLIQGGLRNGQFVERYGFQMTGSNFVLGQSAVSGAALTLTGAPTLNALFTIADEATVTPVGALDFIASATPTGYAVGQIAQIRKGSTVVAHGVILRITTNTLTLVPYNLSGSKLAAAQFDGTETVRVPFVPSVNTFHHEEALLIANRMIREPSNGSGARAASQINTDTNMLIQVFSGNYDQTRVRELMTCYMLTGAKISDFRKAGLALTL